MPRSPGLSAGLGLVVILLIPLLTIAYDVKMDSVAYRVSLWKNSAPAAQVSVVGTYNSLSHDRTTEHPECTVRVHTEDREGSREWTIEVTRKGEYGATP